MSLLTTRRSLQLSVSIGWGAATNTPTRTLWMWIDEYGVCYFTCQDLHDAGVTQFRYPPGHAPCCPACHGWGEWRDHAAGLFMHQMNGLSNSSTPGAALSGVPDNDVGNEREGESQVRRTSGSRLWVNALRPPREQCCRPDKITTVAEFDASRRLDVLEVVNGGEMAVDEDRVGQRPHMLDGLEFRRIGWKEEQMDMHRHMQTYARMPACEGIEPKRSAYRDRHPPLRQMLRVPLRIERC